MDRKSVVRRDGGFVMVLLAAGLLVLICALAGLAVDVSRAYVVRGELQNAADAAALAGAGNLYTKRATAPPVLAWSEAEKAATNFIGKNTAETGGPSAPAGPAALTDGDVIAGYYNPLAPSDTLQPQGTIPGECSVNKNPCNGNSDCLSSEVCVQKYYPAVKVAISKENGKNGGGVATFFARLFGWNQFNTFAESIAVSGYVGTVPPGFAFPFAITSCVVNDYFSRDPLPNPPLEITDTSVYHLKNGGTLASPGQWTDLLPVKDPSANTVKDYIENMVDPNEGTPSPATSLADPIYIDPGTKASVYHKTQELIDKNGGKVTVYVPIVDCNIVPKTVMKIQGFAAFELTSTTNSSMTGHFTQIYSNPVGTGPGGGVSNLVSAPKLIK